MPPCHLCGAAELSGLLDLGAHPMAHHLLSAPDEPAAVHELNLKLCRGCGLVQLDEPIAPETLYENYYLSSWKAQPHIPALLERLRALPGLDHGSRILEVGSNDGLFLKALRDAGYRHLQGIEPARDAREAARAAGFETMEGFFDVPAARRIRDSFGLCDLLVSRQVLEHVSDLATFGRAVQEVLSPTGYVLIEVPDFDFCLQALDYSAIWEEHVNYFTAATLGRFLATWVGPVLGRESYLFSGRALCMLARAQAEPATVTSAPDLEGALNYGRRWPEFRASLHAFLTQERARGSRIAVYGAGCRTSALLNFANVGPFIECVLDDQPEKQGHFMPGSRLPIQAGDHLAEFDLALLGVNAENEEKVMARHQGWPGRFLSLHPPSPRLLGFWQELQTAE